MSYKRIFWGFVLVAGGSLLLLKNFEVLHFRWRDILSLWPILLILWGISIIPMKDIWKTISSFGILLLTVILVHSYGYPHLIGPIQINGGNSHNSYLDWEEEDEEYYKDTTVNNEVKQFFYSKMDHHIQKSYLDFEVAAGVFILDNHTQDNLIEVYKQTNKVHYTMNTQMKDEEARIELKIEKGHDIDFNNNEETNRMNLHLNDIPVWNLNLEVGAAELKFDLSQLKTESISLDGGACKVDVKLSDLQEKVKVEAAFGVASVTFRVPRTSGCNIESDTFLMHKDWEGFKKIKGGLYQSNNFETSTNKVYIELDAAISDFNIVWY